MSAENGTFEGGVPTKPDVDKLMSEIGIPQEGVLIPWESIEKCIRITRTTFRFKTVTHAWRTRLYREHNAFMGAVDGKGLVRLDPNSRVTYGSKKIRHGIRATKRGATLVSLSDRQRMTPENKVAADHVARLSAAFMLAEKAAAREIKLPELDS